MNDNNNRLPQKRSICRTLDPAEIERRKARKREWNQSYYEKNKDKLKGKSKSNPERNRIIYKELH